MSAVLITGCAGAGKSAVAVALARRGLACIDDDEDPFLARFVDLAGTVVAEEPAELDFAWLSRHNWEWDLGRLDALICAAGPATLDMRENNEWGRPGDSREYIRRLRPGYQNRMRASGAVAIDATQSLDQVVDAIATNFAHHVRPLDGRLD